VTTAGPVPAEQRVGEQVFEYESEAVYRLERTAGTGCACERIELQGCPVREMSAHDGQLLVTFIADDVATLRAVVSDLRDREPSVSVRCLKRSSADQTERETMFIDPESFTERQREVLRTAHERGYFDHPKRANATEVSAELDIATSTFAEHLAAAQTKLMDALFPDGAGP
jgi:predicted DNA binding protein